MRFTLSFKTGNTQFNTELFVTTFRGIKKEANIETLKRGGMNLVVWGQILNLIQ